jgi:hypothetical protein
VSAQPAPGVGWPVRPVGGYLYRVAYVTRRGMTFSRLFRQEQAARNFAASVYERDGNPRIDRILLRTSDWDHLDPWEHTWRKDDG